jgi:hypothetical protein
MTTLMFIIASALAGAVVSFVLLWPKGPVFAVLGASFGGSACALVAAIIAARRGGGRDADK